MRSFSIKFELLLPYDTFIQTPGAAVIFMWLYICWGKSSGGCTDQMCHNHTSEQREHAEQEGIFVLWGHFSLLLFLCEWAVKEVGLDSSNLGYSIKQFLLGMAKSEEGMLKHSMLCMEWIPKERIETQNHWGWKRPLRSPSPSPTHPNKPCPSVPHLQVQVHKKMSLDWDLSAIFRNCHLFSETPKFKSELN